MKIVISENRTVSKEGTTAGNIKENKIETLEFEFPYSISNYTKYLEIETADEKYVTRIENDCFVLTRTITKYTSVKMQVIAKDLENDKVFKSDIFRIWFNDSIEATEELLEDEPDLVTQIETDLQKATEELEKLKNRRLISTLITTDNEITEIECENVKRVFIEGTSLALNDDYVLQENKIQFNFSVPSRNTNNIRKRGRIKWQNL